MENLLMLVKLTPSLLTSLAIAFNLNKFIVFFIKFNLRTECCEMLLRFVGISVRWTYFNVCFGKIVTRLENRTSIVGLKLIIPSLKFSSKIPPEFLKSVNYTAAYFKQIFFRDS